MGESAASSYPLSEGEPAPRGCWRGQRPCPSVPDRFPKLPFQSPQVAKKFQTGCGVDPSSVALLLGDTRGDMWGGSPALKGPFWGSAQHGAAEGMGPTLLAQPWVEIIPRGSSFPFPRLAGGLLPYAPTYSSWLDCWSQLHREVSGRSRAAPGCHPAVEKNRVGALQGLGGNAAGLGAALTYPTVVIFPLPGQHEPREQPVFPQGARREAIRVGGEEVSLKLEPGGEL